MTAAAAGTVCLVGVVLLVSGRLLGGPDGWWWRSTALATGAWTAVGVAVLAACVGDGGWWAWAATGLVLAVGAGAARVMAYHEWRLELDGDDGAETQVHVTVFWGGPQRWLTNRGPHGRRRGRVRVPRPLRRPTR